MRIDDAEKTRTVPDSNGRVVWSLVSDSLGLMPAGLKTRIFAAQSLD